MKKTVMKNAFIIMGDENTKKSSTIRCLTGVSKVGNYYIKTINGLIKVSAFTSSLQESSLNEAIRNNINLNQTKYSLNNFLSNKKFINKDNILIALWIDSKTVSGITTDSGIDYIQMLVKHNWNIDGVILLNRNSQDPIIPILSSIVPSNIILPIPFTKGRGANSKPSNEIGTVVRQAWGW